MKHLALLHKTAAALFACSAASVGQSLNIDFGNQAGVPQQSYAAAGLPGVWNAVTAFPADGLVDLSGMPIPVTVSLMSGCAFDPASQDDPATNQDDERLLDDGTRVGDTDTCLWKFENLASGTYKLIVYAWSPGQPDATTTIYFNAFDTSCGSSDVSVGGAFPGQLEQGVTHARDVVSVLGGREWFCSLATSSSDAMINGLQLVRVLPGDANRDGQRNLIDFLSFRNCRTGPDAGPYADGCESFDFDFDDDVDFHDFYRLQLIIDSAAAPPCACSGDLDQSLSIGVFDYLLLRQALNNSTVCDPRCLAADINCDGFIDGCDLEVFSCLINNKFGAPCCEISTCNNTR